MKWQRLVRSIVCIDTWVCNCAMYGKRCSRISDVRTEGRTAITCHRHTCIYGQQYMNMQITGGWIYIPCVLATPAPACRMLWTLKRAYSLDTLRSTVSMSSFVLVLVGPCWETLKHRSMDCQKGSYTPIVDCYIHTV